MKQTNRLFCDLLDFETPEAAHDRLWRAGYPTAAEVRGGAVVFTVPFQAQEKGFLMRPDAAIPAWPAAVTVRAYGDEIVRVSASWDGHAPGDAGPMLEWAPDLKPEPLSVERTATGWTVRDRRGTVRFTVNTTAPESRALPENAMRGPGETWNATVIPDGRTAVPFMAIDSFFPDLHDSLSLAFVTRDGRPVKSVYSLHAAPAERFAGTGERFAGMNLSGHTLLLENADALGVNNRRCYKNIPFYVSSRPYGLFLHTHGHVRLSLADLSTRAAQAALDDEGLDLFFIGGDGIESILRNYRRVTGLPRPVPTWSYGVWMSRMTYRTADEVRDVAARLRDGGFPCDVLHLDVGWFDEDWTCDWKFGRTRFPDPAGFMADMRAKGFRVSLWQLPHVARTCSLYADATARRYAFFSDATSSLLESQFSGLQYVATIDFSNPEAVAWYQGLLADLLRQGASAIKTDFGEHIHEGVPYRGLPPEKLHNLFALLYQKAAFDITQATTGEGIIWARAAWAGSHRYPVHWAGDAAGSWDGLAGCIRGGLHAGLSGFAFWSHDVPGFHGVPDFMGTWPSDDLYVRWTQVGVFSSHFRYHGAHPREPYAYPAIADLVRKWWRLRYALIPYLADEGRKAIASGLPVLRALVFHHADDPLCWHIDDQFYCGDALMVAPILNGEGRRDVYLPAGEWVDIWTGETFTGPRLLRNVTAPIERLPVYAVRNACIRVYPDVVQCTDEMNLERAVDLRFDDSFRGLASSPLGPVSGLA